MGVSRRVQPVDGFGGDPHRRVEAEGDVGAGHVVVDRLGQGQDLDADILELEGVAHGAVAAEDNQGLEIVLIDDITHQRPHVHPSPIAHLHLVDLGPAGPEDRASPGEDAGEGIGVEPDETVLHQPEEPVVEADDVHSVGTLGGLAHRPDGGVQTGAVAAGGEYPDASRHRFMVSAEPGPADTRFPPPYGEVARQGRGGPGYSPSEAPRDSCSSAAPVLPPFRGRNSGGFLAEDPRPVEHAQR